MNPKAVREREREDTIFNRDGIFQYERGLSPYRREPGDCGVMVVYAEEKSGLKDKVDRSGINETCNLDLHTDIFTDKI